MISEKNKDKLDEVYRKLLAEEEKESFLNQHIENSISPSRTNRGRKTSILSESLIRYAHTFTLNNTEAAELLGVDIRTLKKYAKQYIDEETGKDLWEIHKSKKKRAYRRAAKKRKGKYKIPIEEILAGRKTNYSKENILHRIINEGYVHEECMRCGYNEKRVTDFTVPLTIAFKDGKNKNYHADNIEIICLNCYYHYYGNQILTLKDFRSYHVPYSRYVREQIIKHGEEKYRDDWKDELDIDGKKLDRL